MVKKAWERHVLGQTPIQQWNNKFRSMRILLGGWARHTTGVLKQEKLCLSSSIDELETIAEERPLTSQEINLKSQYNAKLDGLLREEELK
jgi:hypothetical protein